MVAEGRQGHSGALEGRAPSAGVSERPAPALPSADAIIGWIFRTHRRASLDHALASPGEFAKLLGVGPRGGLFSASRVVNFESGRYRWQGWLAERYCEVLGTQHLAGPQVLGIAHAVKTHLAPPLDSTVRRKGPSPAVLLDRACRGGEMDGDDWLTVADLVTRSEVLPPMLIELVSLRLLEIVSNGRPLSPYPLEYVALGRILSKHPEVAGHLFVSGVPLRSSAYKVLRSSSVSSSFAIAEQVSQTGELDLWAETELRAVLQERVAAGLPNIIEKRFQGAVVLSRPSDPDPYRHDQAQLGAWNESLPLAALMLIEESLELAPGKLGGGKRDTALEEVVGHAMYSPTEQQRREWRAVLALSAYAPSVLAAIICKPPDPKQPQLARLIGPLYWSVDGDEGLRERGRRWLISALGSTSGDMAWEAAKAVLDIDSPSDTELNLAFSTVAARTSRGHNYAAMSLIELAGRRRNTRLLRFWLTASRPNLKSEIEWWLDRIRE